MCSEKSSSIGLRLVLILDGRCFALVFRVPRSPEMDVRGKIIMLAFLLCSGDNRRKRKMGEIAQALSVSPVDVATLRRMAISEGGLLTDEIRCQVWPWLLNVPPQVLDQEPGTSCRMMT